VKALQPSGQVGAGGEASDQLEDHHAAVALFLFFRIGGATDGVAFDRDFQAGLVPIALAPIPLLFLALPNLFDDERR
jgi:hypothetical protein